MNRWQQNFGKNSRETIKNDWKLSIIIHVWLSLFWLGYALSDYICVSFSWYFLGIKEVCACTLQLWELLRNNVFVAASVVFLALWASLKE